MYTYVYIQRRCTCALLIFALYFIHSRIVNFAELRLCFLAKIIESFGNDWCRLLTPVYSDPLEVSLHSFSR